MRNECRGFLHDNRKFTLSECRCWFKQTSPHFYLIRLDGKRVGYFRTSDWDHESKTVTIGGRHREKLSGQRYRIYGLRVVCKKDDGVGWY